MSADDLCFLNGAEAARRIAAGELSPVALVEAILARIEAVQPALTAFTIVCADEALAGAREAEAAVARGDPLGPLHGVPFTVKDMIDVAGMRITFGSPMFEHNVPAADTVVVERLRRSGAILLGITNMAECGHKGTNSNPLWGVTRNPWDLEATPAARRAARRRRWPPAAARSRSAPTGPARCASPPAPPGCAGSSRRSASSPVPRRPTCSTRPR